MQIDETLKGFLLEIQKEVKNRFGEEFDIQELADIVSSFYSISLKGMEKAMHVELPYLGKFIMPYKDEVLEVIRDFTKEERENGATSKYLKSVKKDTKVTNKKVTTLKEFKNG